VLVVGHSSFVASEVNCSAFGTFTLNLGTVLSLFKFSEPLLALLALIVELISLLLH
jgi:hypothetical protein